MFFQVEMILQALEYEMGKLHKLWVVSWIRPIFLCLDFNNFIISFLPFSS